MKGARNPRGRGLYIGAGARARSSAAVAAARGHEFFGIKRELCRQDGITCAGSLGGR